jgi:hypothetical protein
MMKKIQRTGFWGLAFFLCLAVSANGEMRMPLKKADEVLSKKAAKVLPDLIVQEIQLSGLPKEGEVICAPSFFRIMVKNTTAGLAQGSKIRLQCNLKNSRQKQCPGELSGFLNIPDLSGGKSVTLQWPKPSRSQWIAGDYTLTVEIDHQNIVQESNEKNNKQTFRFSIAKSQAIPPKRDNSAGLPNMPIQMRQAENQRGKNVQPSIPDARYENSDTGNSPKFKAERSLPIVLNASSEPAPKMEMSDEAICRDYAQEAVDQFLQAENNMCGFQGGGWQNDYDKHFDWCMSASQDQRKQESKNRKSALTSCGEIKRFDNPRYLGLLADFCMYRRTETHSSTPIEGELYDYDFGWTCGVPEVAQSYCISQGYAEMVEFKVADDKASENTMPLGNHHRCDATIPLSNCRGFDYIVCRKPVSDKPMLKMKSKTLSAQSAKVAEKKDFISFETTEAICQDYAETAVRQYHQATNSYCNLSIAFEAGSWHGDVKVHHDWCLTASPGQRQAETAKRQERLAVCAQTERKRFEKPMFNGKRADTFVNFRKPNIGEPEVPQRAADLFCQEMGYEKAIHEWFQYNTTFSTESLNNTIHMGEGHPECNTDWPSFNDKCEGFNHITCERTAQP